MFNSPVTRLFARQLTTAAKKGSTPTYNVSPALKTILGKGVATRQEGLKGVWAYIKTHELQDPAAKRNVIADEALSKVFGQKNVTMFQVMKLLAPNFVSKV